MSGWISVNDRLPDESGVYIVYTSVGIIYGEMSYSARYRKFNTRDESEDFKYVIDCVTHWMPLPEPPKEEIT